MRNGKSKKWVVRTSTWPGCQIPWSTKFYGLREANEKRLSTIFQKTGCAQEEIGRISDDLTFDLPTRNPVTDQNLAKEAGLKVVSRGDAGGPDPARNRFAKHAGRHRPAFYSVPRYENAGLAFADLFPFVMSTFGESLPCRPFS